MGNLAPRSVCLRCLEQKGHDTTHWTKSDPCSVCTDHLCTYETIVTLPGDVGLDEASERFRTEYDGLGIRGGQIQHSDDGWKFRGGYCRFCFPEEALAGRSDVAVHHYPEGFPAWGK